MASQVHHPETEEASLNPLGRLAALFAQYGQNASSNIQDTYNSMTIHSWIRLVIIVGGYMLMRPYMLKFVTKGAVKKMEEDEEKEKAQAKITPNELRGVKQQLEAHDEDDEGEGEGTATDWGHKARLRQRDVLKKMLEAEEKRKQEEEDDQDIAEFLTD